MNDRGLWHISINHRYMVVALDQVKSAEDVPSSQLVPQILHVGQGIPVWGGDVVETPVVTHHMAARSCQISSPCEEEKPRDCVTGV